MEGEDSLGKKLALTEGGKPIPMNFTQAENSFLNFSKYFFEKDN